MGEWTTALGAADGAAIGRKGAGLAALAAVPGVRVPDTQCVTTHTMRAFLASIGSLPRAMAAIRALPATDLAGIESASDALRAQLGSAPVPHPARLAIEAAAAALGPGPYVVRSSGLAEDGDTTSFAGLHDSLLGVAAADVVDAVRAVWASAFTARAVAYRLRRGLDPADAALAVLLQPQLAPRAAGTVFTAHPVSGHRGVCLIEAVPGLGDGLVTGRARPEAIEVREGEVTRGAPDLPPTLSDAEAKALAALGKRIEAAAGAPRDVEWCLDDTGFTVVQSRPITTLFPVPAAPDGSFRVYVSVGHQQMMTDAMKPLGLSLFLATALRPMTHAGGRLFVDVTAALASPGRSALLSMIGRSEPLIRDALEAAAVRGGLPCLPPGPPAPTPPPLDPDPTLVPSLVAEARASTDALAHTLGEQSGIVRLDAILADLVSLKRSLSDPASLRAVFTSMDAAAWLEEHLAAWLGEAGASAVLAQSVPHNVTSEMGLALLDVADVVRDHPEVVATLTRAGRDDRLLERLGAVEGGPAARDAIRGFLEAYGARCVGEIDVTRPRWTEAPSALVPLLLAHVHTFAPGEAARRFAEGRDAAARKESSILDRLRALPDGDAKAAEAARWIARLRAFAGYREFPKFLMVSRYACYRRALLAEARALVAAGVLDRVEDVDWLTLDELRSVVETRTVDRARLRARAEAFAWHETLSPPRVLTSDGERFDGDYHRDDVPPGALAGIGVSCGVVEGRARVVLDLAGAALTPGDILVTRFTDPSWTPAFVALTGLVTEVGGRTTHGAVIAREYGLPAVVGVIDATTRIRDGQRIRVHGASGVVELLP